MAMNRIYQHKFRSYSYTEEFQNFNKYRKCIDPERRWFYSLLGKLHENTSLLQQFR